VDLQTSSQTIGAVTIIKLKGKLDAQSAPAVNDQLKALISAGKARIVLDLEGLSYISSAGLGILNANQAEARKGGGMIRIAAITPQVKDVFDLLKFTLLFPMFASTQEALKDF
jgi:anti-sigma B factor antagonist